MGPGYGERLEFNGGELYYTESVTEAEAEKLGDYFVKIAFFDGEEKSVQFDKEGDALQVRLVILPDFQDSAEVRKDLEGIAAETSRSLFDGNPVEVHICDDQFETVHVVKAG